MPHVKVNLLPLLITPSYWQAHVAQYLVFFVVFFYCFVVCRFTFFAKALFVRFQLMNFDILMVFSAYLFNCSFLKARLLSHFKFKCWTNLKKNNQDYLFISKERSFWTYGRVNQNTINTAQQALYASAITSMFY